MTQLQPHNRPRVGRRDQRRVKFTRVAPLQRNCVICGERVRAEDPRRIGWARRDGVTYVGLAHEDCEDIR